MVYFLCIFILINGREEYIFMYGELMQSAFSVIIKNSKDLVFLKDKNLVYRYVSMPFAKMAGKNKPEDITGHTDSEIFDDPSLAKRYTSDDIRLLNDGRDHIEYIEPITDDNGNARYGSTSKYILRNDKGQAIGILGITKDITREYIARRRYQQELGYLFELPKDTYAVCYIDVDDWRIISQRRQKILKGTLQECQTIEEMCEYALQSIIDEESDANEFYLHFTKENLHDIYSSGRRMISFSYERRLSDNSSRWIKNDVNFLTDVDSGHLCIMLSAKDINDIKIEQQKLAEAARLDSMTMLLNHESTMDSIKLVLENEHDRQHAVFMIDIDNFKDLNDTMGHRFGDEFLIELSKELKKKFRETDIVGRIGGDEFLALMRNVPDKNEAERKAEEILAMVRKISAKYSQISLSASIGIGIYPENGKTLDELYPKADAALYEAKGSGKNVFRFI